jgi:hypothetical protein
MPFEVRRAIDELVELQQTCYEHSDLHIHIAETFKHGGSSVIWFFRQVYEDLRTDKRSILAAFSASEFKQFFEAEYRRLDQANTERQAQAKADAERQAQTEAEKREEYKRRARADFDALGKEMTKATTRADLAPYAGVS